MKIGVIGSGSWGTAVAVMLSSNKENEVVLWSWRQDESERLNEKRENVDFLPNINFNDNIICTNDKSICAKGADLLVLATPSHAVRATISGFAPLIADGQKIVIISKGLEDKTLLTLSAIVKQEVPQSMVAVMSGPSHAEEVAVGMPTTNVVASEDLAVAEFVQDVFMNKYFRVYTNDDMLGVELGGSLKNVIALCAGICDGLGFGDNTKAALMTRGIAEIARLGVAMGARQETFLGLSGIGDLIVTCTSMHSRNRRAGILIGKGYSKDEALKEVKMVVEGVYAAAAGHSLAQKYGVSMPIVAAAYGILFDNKHPKDAVHTLMMREKTQEHERENEIL